MEKFPHTSKEVEAAGNHVRREWGGQWKPSQRDDTQIRHIGSFVRKSGRMNAGLYRSYLTILNETTRIFNIPATDILTMILIYFFATRKS